MTQPSTSSSRRNILDRIRSATKPLLAGAAPAESPAYTAIARDYIHRGSLPREAVLKLLIERLREYDAEVVESLPEEIPAAIARKLTAAGKRILAAPEGLAPEWLVPGFEWRIDHALSAHAIEQTEGVVTAAHAAVADSGTIALHHSPAEGRRLLTLLPDWHLCILRASQVVETLPEYFARCAQPPHLATWISGPSATADIEMTRIKGVHGPRFLQIILVHDTPADLK